MPEAVWFAEPRRVEIRDEPRKRLTADDIRVEALASGISAGSELLVYRGEAPPSLEPDLPTIGGGFGFPVKFGYASVGRVVEAGSEVSEMDEDGLVFVHHPHQTEYVVPAAAAIVLPRGVPPEVGVLSANVETASTVVLDAHPRLSETVLVTGQGVVGLLVTMLLRRTGARVIAVDAHPRRREASEAFGAVIALAPGDDLAGHVARETGGRGVDVAIEASGNPRALQSCIDSVAFAGMVVVASWYGSREVTLGLGEAFHRKRIRVVSSQVSTLDPALRERWDRARRTELVRELLCEQSLSSLVSHRFPFREAAAAYELLDHKPEECLQVVLDYV